MSLLRVAADFLPRSTSPSVCDLLPLLSRKAFHSLPLVSLIFFPVLILLFLGSPLTNSSPSLVLLSQLSEFTHSSLYPFLPVLSLGQTLSLSIDPLHPSSLSSSTILVSLVSTSTPLICHLTSFMLPPPAHFVSSWQPPVSLSLHPLHDSGHASPPPHPGFGYPEPPCWFVSVVYVLG